MSELKACPFCGNEPDTYWNTRPIEDALRQRIAELEARVLPDEVLDQIEAELEKALERYTFFPATHEHLSNLISALCKARGK